MCGIIGYTGKEPAHQFYTELLRDLNNADMIPLELLPLIITGFI